MATVVAARGVIFDLFGTLVPGIPRPVQRRMLDEVAAAMDIPEEPLLRIWKETENDRTTGHFASLKETFEYIAERLGSGARGVDRAVEIRRAYIRRLLTPRPNAINVLSDLRDLGFRLGMVSNCSVEVPRLWPECPLAALVDAPVFSATVGSRKPNRDIFEIALCRLELPATRCFYVGDGDSGELGAAASLGMDVIHLAEPSELGGEFLRHEEEEWDGAVAQSLVDVSARIKEALRIGN